MSIVLYPSLNIASTELSIKSDSSLRPKDQRNIIDVLRIDAIGLAIF